MPALMRGCGRELAAAMRRVLPIAIATRFRRIRSRASPAAEREVQAGQSCG
jgi:hypothetical protein